MVEVYYCMFDYFFFRSFKRWVVRGDGRGIEFFFGDYRFRVSCFFFYFLYSRFFSSGVIGVVGGEVSIGSLE